VCVRVCVHPIVLQYFEPTARILIALPASSNLYVDHQLSHVHVHVCMCVSICPLRVYTFTFVMTCHDDGLQACHDTPSRHILGHHSTLDQLNVAWWDYRSGSIEDAISQRDIGKWTRRDLSPPPCVSIRSRVWQQNRNTKDFLKLLANCSHTPWEYSAPS